MSDSASNSAEKFDTQGWSPKALKWLEEQRLAGRVFSSTEEADAAYIASQRPPFPNPTEKDLRRERMYRAIQSGQRPDPEDLAEEQAEQVRYQRAVAEAFKKKFKDPSVPDLPEQRTKPDTLLGKFWRLTESNFFMGGGVGMAIAAYAFLLGGAPKFAIFLLVVAWLVITVSTYRHDFFEGKTRSAQLTGQTLIPIGVAVVLAVLWLSLRSAPSIERTPIIQSQPSSSITPLPIPSLPATTLTPQAQPSVLTTPPPSPSVRPSPKPQASSTPIIFAKPSHFNGQLPLKAGSPQRLSSLLIAEGYKGSMLLEELTYCNADSNTTELYIGQSNVSSKNGFSQSPSDCYTQRAASPQDVIDATQIYFFISTLGKVKIILRSK